ncbi:hypothetical protein SLS58_004750 [Diplodia intermedia]|uniref:Uncharacterized protein n=1 Tax=Diplodia intermedia TaxID=856260 RepID=A0ABR3TSU4_9PEZI
MDSDIGPEHGISRAGQSILRMNEAGYPTFGWDRVVKLFSGWDSDGSPVIQHRRVLGRIEDAIASALKEGQAPRETPYMRDVDHEVWAARIRTTRTVEESWAIFLTYDALEVQSPQKRLKVYVAMFERIYGARKLSSPGRQKRAALQPGYVNKKEAVPGDEREALPTPDSPHERLDPRLQPPSVDELFVRMISKDVYPDNDCLSLLLRTTKLIPRGLSYISSRGDQSVRALLELHLTDEQIKAVPEKVFNAYIDLLCRQCFVVDKYHFVDNARKGDGLHKFESWRNGTTELLRQTLKVSDNAGVELDAEGFKIVCFSFGFRALIRRDQTMAQYTEESRKVAWAHQLQHNENDSWFLRALFSKVVGLGDGTHFKPHIAAASGRESAATPTVLSVPSAVVLHSYIRALGIMGDYEGLLSIASFMHDNVAGLLHHCDNELNGHVRLRRTVVALRCFLERSWDNQLKQLSWPPTEEHELDALDELDQRADQGTIMKVEPAPEELIVLVRDKVEDLAATWGHWPSDGELQEYVDWIEVRHM